MSTALLVRRAAMVICFCLSLGLPLRTASAADDRYCDATYISGDRFFKELKEVNVALNVDPLIAKIIPEDDLRKRVADALGPYNITVRDQAPVTLFVNVDDSPRDIKRTMTYSDGSRTEDVYHCHVIYCEMAFFVRATALRNGKFHLVAASLMYSSNIFTLQQQTGIGKLLFGDDISEELKRKLQLNLADRMKFFATPGPADNPEPWIVDNWSDQQKSTMNDAYTAFIKSDPKIEKRPIDGLDTAPELKLTSDIQVEGLAEDPSWKKLWQSECENLGLVKPADPPALVIRHYFGCEVNHHPAFQAFDDMFDEIVLRESNLVFNFNGRLVRKQASIFSYHRSMVAGKDDLNSVTDNYLLRSLKEFEANLRAGDQPLPAMEAPSVSQPKDITERVALGMRFARVEPGMFVMGSPETEAGRAKSEMQHAVKLTKPFYMATNDVTRAQFAVFVADANFKTDAENANDENTWRHNKVFEQEETCPVVNVSWSDAIAFIAWLSKRDHKTYRLPTEAEWECACRAGTTTTFNTGDTINSDQANYDGAGVKGVCRWKTMPVGSFPANKWGLYDMHGNVWQWCSDVFADYPNDTVADPTGPAPDPKASHVLRGGSWGIDPVFLRSASRLDGAPGSHGGYNVGFRVASDSP
jgi:formylglycine-generating enzyme required for sulfatase activity